MNNRIFVTGATGNVGRQVVAELVARGAKVRALSRTPERANLPGGVEVVGGDLSAPATLEGHFDNVSAVFLLLRFPATLEAVPSLLSALPRTVKRLVFLSSSIVRDDLEEQINPIGKLHAEVEQWIARSGLDWTFVRPGAFATNARGWWGPQIRAGDVVRWPYRRAAFPPIHERDIAAVSARALVEEGHGGKKYLLTGPASLTHEEQVRTIAEVIGRPLRFEELSPEAARAEVLAQLPPWLVDMLLDSWAQLLANPAPITATVADVTGAPARPFRAWVVDHAGEFRSDREGPARTVPDRAHFEVV
jgi:uncharacterized protein YbjT (DUF2867 family)